VTNQLDRQKIALLRGAKKRLGSSDKARRDLPVRAAGVTSGKDPYD